MTDWVPVVDISKNNGAVDFAKMRAKGVRGVIIRACHGTTIDVLFASNVTKALAAGYAESDLVAYEFCNPKRGTPQQCADALMGATRAMFGHDETPLMLDIETYATESPFVGTAWPAKQYATWLHDHIGILRTHWQGTIFGYTNRAYWDSGVADPVVAAMLEYIGARYPVVTTVGYERHPLPADPALWDEWAFSLSPGPQMPTGAPAWGGWQFSAEWNWQGAPYGCQGRDLDLDIIHADAWARWTNTGHTPSTTGELTMLGFNSAPMSFGGKNYQAGEIKFAVHRDRTKPVGQQFSADRLDPADWLHVAGMPEGPLSVQQLAGMGVV